MLRGREGGDAAPAGGVAKGSEGEEGQWREQDSDTVRKSSRSRHSTVRFGFLVAALLYDSQHPLLKITRMLLFLTD